jgi:glutamate-5-semialdehyde dehydrogenase
MYIHPSADPETALGLIEGSLDRLAVCNRLNWLLIDQAIWEVFLPRALEVLERLGVEPSLPPHAHPFSKEWATDAEHEATVTVAPVSDASEALALAHEHTSGLAAAVIATDEEAAAAFLGRYRGTGGFWNATTRWLDGFELTAAPETGISVDNTPGPRGPVTYRDLYLRQYVVIGDGTQRR